ncbi:hypothetical protein [Breoghania sp. L-A4]|uniref:hypothetical protein n=1 Tax=Breoghania sp. L-A4 TaxID=2304600 RepID=UPI000E35F9D2|nr:hypothetical protein [Breoghania sp. L-A4]AXS42311.1 hypothetical protein D1F64_22880 [Breoghania sp. L-A4]
MNNYFKQGSLAVAVLATLNSGALAETPAPDASALLTDTVIGALRQIVMDDVIQISVKAQNARHASLDAAKIDELDKMWRAETEATGKQPLIARTLSNPASIFLLRKQAQALGLYSEIFLMDDKGLNVGQSSVTSDYWQGDEDKWQKTFLKGGEAVFVDAPEWHEDSHTWRVQVNVSVADAATGKPIGAVTFEMNLTELERRTRA